MPFDERQNQNRTDAAICNLLTRGVSLLAFFNEQLQRIRDVV